MAQTAIRTLALAAASLASLASWAQTDDDRIRNAVDTAIKPIMAKYDIPGMAVAVTVQGRAHFYSYGVAARQGKQPVSENTLFELGSVSKTFTATLAAYAQRQGKLNLGDHPSRYLPELKDRPIDNATLLHLGTYTAGGLPLQLPEWVNTDADLSEYFQQWQPAAQPGTQRLYSNPSLGLFGRATAKALGQDFASAMEGIVLKQLGLAHSYVKVPASAMANYAWGHNQEGKQVRVNPSPLDVETYGIKASAADMIRYVEANIDPTNLPEPMRQAVEDTHVAYFQVGPLGQGLGWEQFPYPGTLPQLLAGNSEGMLRQPNLAEAIPQPQQPVLPTLFDKTGSTGGFGAYVAFVPAKRMGIVILANKGYPIPARVEAAYGVLKVLAATPAP